MESLFRQIVKRRVPTNTCDPLLSEEVEDITEAEVETGVKEMKNERFTDTDETPTELWKSVGAIGIIFCSTKWKPNATIIARKFSSLLL